MPVQVKKASGDIVDFNEEKLRRSMRNAGASDEAIDEVIRAVNEILEDGITTKIIYQKAFALLKKKSTATAGRYKLKKAILELGPSGYPFESFVAEILKYQGFRTEVGVYVPGHCVEHEVDVVAEKDHHHYMVECKFHNTFNRHCDVKVPLYINSRFDDIEKEYLKDEKHKKKFHQGWIFTNTRFTSDAIQYGNCAGLKLVGWDFPKRGSLKERINIAGLHPISCLTTLNKKEKESLFEAGIVLCRNLCENNEVLNRLGLSENRKHKILKEAEAICELQL